MLESLRLEPVGQGKTNLGEDFCEGGFALRSD